MIREMDCKSSSHDTQAWKNSDGVEVDQCPDFFLEEVDQAAIITQIIIYFAFSVQKKKGLCPNTKIT